jgi:DNA-binding Xre family transcriptional regulator
MDFIQSGVPVAESLPEDIFLAFQKGRVEAATEALSKALKSGAIHPLALSYLKGICRLLEGVGSDLEALIRKKTRESKEP